MSDGTEPATCLLCGEPLPPGEQMFRYHGYSGVCPKPPLPRVAASPADHQGLIDGLTQANAALRAENNALLKRLEKYMR